MEILSKEKEFKEKYKPYLNEKEHEIETVKIEDLLNNLRWKINKTISLEKEK